MPTENLYLVHNTTRHPANKSQRLQLVGSERSSKRLILAGGVATVVVGRPTPVSESTLKACLEDVIDKSKKGLVKVTTANNLPVDLEALRAPKPQVKKAAPAPAPSLVKAETPTPISPEPRPEPVFELKSSPMLEKVEDKSEKKKSKKHREEDFIK